MDSMLRSRVVAVCILLLLIPGSPVPAGDDATTCLWRVESGEGSLWLLGSLHLLHPEASTLPPAMERAVSRARLMVFEIDFESATDTRRLLLRSAALPAGQRLDDLLDDTLRARFHEALRAAGLPPGDLQDFEPWYAAITLAGAGLRRAGYETSRGIDLSLWNRARAARIPTRGLETAEQQIAFLDALDTGVQLQMLRQTLDEMDGLVPRVDELTRLWREGRAAELADILKSSFAGSPELYRRFVVQRNGDWLPRIEHLARTRRDTVVVVGVLHLVGEDGLVTQLSRRGLTVTRE